MTAITGAGTTLFSTSSLFDKLDRLSSRTLTGGAYTQTTAYAYEWGTTLPQSVTVNGSTVSYTYDAAGNITSITDGSLVTYYTYDSLNQLIREDNAYSNKTVVYTYDNGGNILSRTEYPYSPTVEDITTLTPTNTVTYTYGNADWKDQLTSFNGEAITYDAIGNPLTYRGMTLTWQNGRQLATLSKAGLTANYTYDESGLRTSKTVNGITTEYYWNGSILLAQKTGDSCLHFLYDEDGALVGFNNETKTYIYTRNAQGDIISITDTSNGNTVAQYTYDSWGNVLTATGVMAEVNPFRYRGYYYDSETGLYALQSRYYDPQTGRFLNLDDFDTLSVTPEELTDKNLYAYCDNNPIMRVDRGGEFWGAIARFVGGVVAQYVGDVIGNVIEGKTGWDILKPTSSVGDYLAAGVTALIPGTGIGSALGRSVVTEGIKCVEESLNGENFDLGKSALRIAKNTAMDKAASWVSDKASKAIDAKMPRNYSSYAGVQYKKYPGITKAQIQAKIRKLDSLKNFSNGAVSFSMDILLNSLPF